MEKVDMMRPEKMRPQLSPCDYLQVPTHKFSLLQVFILCTDNLICDKWYDTFS